MMLSRLALFFVLLGSSAASAEDPLRFVIAVGYNAGGDDPRPALAYADDDAARFYRQQLHEAEKAWLLTTFDLESARRYPEFADIARPPTHVELARVVGEVIWLIKDAKSQNREQRTELVFYFAGHGDTDPGGEGYLVLPDGPLTRRQLREQVLAVVPTDLNHVVLDACASYFVVNERGEASSQRVPLSPRALEVIERDRSEDPALAARTGVFVSTTGSAAVHETPALASGVFSYLLRSGLSGAADLNGDGRIDYIEAAGFVQAATDTVDDRRARIEVYARPPAQRRSAALATLDEDRRFLEVPREAKSVQILDSRGIPYATVHHAGERPVLVALEGDAFYTVAVGDREAVLVPRGKGTYALEGLNFVEKSRARGDGAWAALFERPYGPAYLDGFASQSDLMVVDAAGAFRPEYAVDGAPPAVFPARGFAIGSFVLGVGFAATAVGFSVANLNSFAALERDVAETGVLDPRLAVEVEGYRTGAAAASAAAIAAFVVGGTFWLWSAVEAPEERGTW